VIGNAGDLFRGRTVERKVGRTTLADTVRRTFRRQAGERVSRALDMDAEGTNFFKALLDELYLREPTIRPR
jgi:hypothetical protein